MGEERDAKALSLIPNLALISKPQRSGYNRQAVANVCILDSKLLYFHTKFFPAGSA